jgi:hypothetical protein
MAHQIMGSRFMSRTEPAWHGLGTVFASDLKITASEAVAKVAGDVQVIDTPLFHYDDNGAIQRVEAYKAILRKPTHDNPKYTVLGVTSDNWQKIDYVDLAKALDPLSETYRLETCGLVFEGARLFMAFKGPDFSVVGDQMQDYFLVELSMEPGVSHGVLASPVRAVCDNTCRMAHKQASIALKVPHGRSQVDRIGWAADLVAKFRSITSTNQAIFEQFAKTQITMDNLNILFEAAWPDPPKPMDVQLLERIMTSQDQGAMKTAMGDRFDRIVKAQAAHATRCERVLRLREAGLESFERFKPEHLRGTVWAGYNAVTEVADWREGGKDSAVSTMWGTRATEKTRAFASAMKIADINTADIKSFD